MAITGTDTSHQREGVQADTVTATTLVVSCVSASANIGTTLSALVGFYGKAGTSQPSGAAQATLTATMTTSGAVGFATLTQASAAMALLAAIRQALVDNGMIAGA